VAEVSPKWLGESWTRTSWLEAQLVRELAQVKAPDSLWTRVQAERRERRSQPRMMWMLWPAVAMVLLGAAIDLSWQAAKAVEAAGSRIASSNPAEIRAWVKAKANMDVNLNCGGAAKIQLTGARLMHVRDEVVAEIAYQLEGKPGLLTVSKGESAVFTVPLPKDLEASCRSCHV